MGPGLTSPISLLIFGGRGGSGGSSQPVIRGHLPRVTPDPEVAGRVRSSGGRWSGIEIFVIDHRFLGSTRLKSGGLFCVSVPKGAVGILVVNDDIIGKSLPICAAGVDEWLPPPVSQLLVLLEILLSQTLLK